MPQLKKIHRLLDLFDRTGEIKYFDMAMNKLENLIGEIYVNSN